MTKSTNKQIAAIAKRKFKASKAGIHYASNVTEIKRKATICNVYRVFILREAAATATKLHISYINRDYQTFTTSWSEYEPLSVDGGAAKRR